MGHALVRQGIRISQVLGRKAESVHQLADELNAKGLVSPEHLDPDADTCLICVSDDAIRNTVEALRPGDRLCLHTAGSVSMDIFEGIAANYGVLYPLQTLTRNQPVNFEDIPLLIEANSANNLESVSTIANRLSTRVIMADFKQRSSLHLAAMFAGNFTNHMFTLAEEILHKEGLSLELLYPLMKEIFAKAMRIPPRLAQTGPASRGNTRIIEKHLSMLNDYPEMRELYRLISQSIGKRK